ncbi:hypothetical protein J437_LFUL006185 [Ladona fulva]|uniref:Menorin-like domain-containing protein n=1 Tax=Ladona fulva TaxID=123851 RepID=A0A8K0K142_LADFU|nr:hypothetical protein J437_LFUL006185 [Ladona fulva]
MLEADIVLGTLVSGSGDLFPIMGHPPANTSDISLAQFIAFVEEGIKGGGKRKGVKLDFKTTEVFKASLPMNFPVMLNADILQGPIESKRTPVDADAFLYACRTIFPDATLSVGWTSLYGSDEGAENPNDVPEDLTFYNSDNVMDMMDALRRNSVNQTLTFPVRAGIAARSLRDLPALLEQQGSSFTLWSAKDDPVDVEDLKKLIEIVGKRRVYIDVPDSLRKQLTSSGRPLLGSASMALLAVIASMVLLR